MHKQLVFTNTSDMRHEKVDLKVIVVAIPKEGWARMAAYDTDFLEFESFDFIDHIL